MSTRLKYLGNKGLSFALIITLITALPLILLIKMFLCTNRGKGSKNVLFGFDPLINNKFWSQMLKGLRYRADSVVVGLFSINKKNDFDIVIDKPTSFLYQFFRCLLVYDIFVLSFNGGLISRIGFPWLEPLIYRILKIKIVIIAYGSDVTAYDFINKPSYSHVLNSFYPQDYKKNRRVKSNLMRWQRYGDFVIPAMFFSQGLYRNDLLTPNALNFPVEEVNFKSKKSKKSKKSSICIVHSPNHRIIKGSEYIINVIEKLKKRYEIEFILLEGRKHDEVLSILKDQADIFVEKLIGPSYALSAIEALAYGVPVVGSIDNGDWDDLAKAYRRYSFLGECPIVSANVENLEHKLSELCASSELRNEISRSSREYVLRYHSYAAGRILFEEIFKYLDQTRGDLKNFYHPLLGEYNNRSSDCMQVEP